MWEWCEVTGIADWQIGKEGKQQVERPKKVFCCSTRHLYIYQHATDDGTIFNPIHNTTSH